MKIQLNIVMCGALLLAATSVSLGQSFASFVSTQPGSPGSPEPIALQPDGDLDIPSGPNPTIVLNATYSAGPMYVSNPNPGAASFDVTIAAIKLSLAGTGLQGSHNPLELLFGSTTGGTPALTGAALNVPGGGSGLVTFDLPTTLAGTVSAPLVLSPGEDVGSYQLRWWVSAATVKPVENGKQDGTLSSAHSVQGTLAPVPEPSAYALVVGLGLLGLAAWRRAA